MQSSSEQLTFVLFFQPLVCKLLLSKSFIIVPLQVQGQEQEASKYILLGNYLHLEELLEMRFAVVFAFQGRVITQPQFGATVIAAKACSMKEL